MDAGGLVSLTPAGGDVSDGASRCPPARPRAPPPPVVARRVVGVDLGVDVVVDGRTRVVVVRPTRVVEVEVLDGDGRHPAGGVEVGAAPAATRGDLQEEDDQGDGPEQVEDGVQAVGVGHQRPPGPEPPPRGRGVLVAVVRLLVPEVVRVHAHGWVLRRKATHGCST